MSYIFHATDRPYQRGAGPAVGAGFHQPAGSGADGRGDIPQRYLPYNAGFDGRPDVLGAAAREQPHENARRDHKNRIFDGQMLFVVESFRLDITERAEHNAGVPL